MATGSDSSYSVRPDKLTTAGIALLTAEDGRIVYDTDLDKLKHYDGNVWRIIQDEGLTASGSAFFGLFAYSDLATQSSPIAVTGGGGFVDLTNDTLGAQTNTSFPPDGITSLWNASTNRMDFTELSLGSQVHYRFDTTITTVGANAEVDMAIEAALGAFNYTIGISRQTFKSAGTYNMTVGSFIWIGDTNTGDNPAKIKIESTNDATIAVNGWSFYVHKY